jgi:hypothetical protein
MPDGGRRLPRRNEANSCSYGRWLLPPSISLVVRLAVMTVRAQFWSLIASWMIGGLAIGFLWVVQIISYSRFLILLILWMAIISAFNLL